jgi:hypothetical protein
MAKLKASTKVVDTKRARPALPTKGKKKPTGLVLIVGQKPARKVQGDEFRLNSVVYYLERIVGKMFEVVWISEPFARSALDAVTCERPDSEKGDLQVGDADLFKSQFCRLYPESYVAG